MDEGSRPDTTSAAHAAFHVGTAPITAPVHSWMTSPAQSHPHAPQAKDLPLHLIQLILNYLYDAGDLARVTRTSRLFYYMTLPRLYEVVTLRSHAEIRYVDGRPEGYGSGSPFAMGLNTLVSRNFTEYIRIFRVVGDWREHDIDEYKQGRVPDNSMILQVALRAAMDKMKNLRAFAWELNTKPLHTVYQSLMTKTALTSLTLRCPTKRMPRPTTTISPLPNLKTLVVYNIDPLCYPDDISMLLLGAKKLENLKLHWDPRMRDCGEESINLLTLFSRCITAKYAIPIKRLAIYNLYTRFHSGGLEEAISSETQEELTAINCMGSSDPMTIFLDDTWRVHSCRPVPANLKMLRVDQLEKESLDQLRQIRGLERFYIVHKPRRKGTSLSNGNALTPTSQSTPTPASINGSGSRDCTPKLTEGQCKGIAKDVLATLESNHASMRHLLLSDSWSLTPEAVLALCKACPHLEQIGFACLVPPMQVLRQIMSYAPRLHAIRMLIPPESEILEKMESIGIEMHEFVIKTEMWRSEYRNLKYVGIGDRLIWKLGNVVWPSTSTPVPAGQENSLNARRAGPMRRLERVKLENVQHIEIWGFDTTEFDPSFP